jgi:ABC-2 type transport system ATP-binding protein
MKRRLMIARALVHEPKLLILDEPTAGVDIEIRRSMWEFLREINAAGTTIILTTHYLEEAESLCSHVAIIDTGKIIEDAPMSTVLRKLQREVVVLSLAEKIKEVPRLVNYKMLLREDNDLEVEIKPSHNLNDLFKQLNERNITVVSMRNKTNRLEELFMGLIEKKSDSAAKDSP